MSTLTQNHTTIPFSYFSPQSPIRLLELPPKLLSLLHSEKPPILKIKSATQSSSTQTSAKPSSETHAVLCTPSETFALKHVHCSNSIFLLESCLQDPSNLESDEKAPEYGLRIVSTTPSYLELLPANPDPVFYLRKLLPVYHGWEEDAEPDAEGDLQMLEAEIEKSGWEGIRDKVPVSDAEFMRGWIEVAGFELNSVPHRPSAILALNILNKVQFATTLSSIKLFDPSKPFTTSSIHSALEDDDCPVSVLEGLLRRICDPLRGQWGNDSTEDDAGWTVNKERLREWVGRLILEREYDKRRAVMVGQKQSLPLIAFIDLWKTSLPDEYQEAELSLGMLNGYHYLPTSNTISFLEPGTVCPSGTEGIAAPIPTGLAKPKGKWHEKFAAKKRK